MITRADIDERVREWGLAAEVVEKDYVLGWVLWGIGTEPALAEHWIFKGGTCLKKCYLETYRFSEDLDFTVLQGGPILPADVEPPLRAALERVSEESGINFSREPMKLKGHSSGNYTEGRIYYVGPRADPRISKIQVDLSASEQVVRPTVLRDIAHAYPDALPEPGVVRSYCFAEVFAEKIRALGERGRPRDLYDAVNLYRRTDLGVQPSEILAVLIEKCRTKGVPVPNVTTVFTDERRAELDADWPNMLAHQLPALPPLADFLAEVPHLFDWLNGASAAAPARALEVRGAEPSDPSWRAPANLVTWNVGVPLESIRFAAVNRLCVELQYNGSWRTIEPYSLRRSRAGNYLLHAVRADDKEARSYRVDRIQGVRLTNRSFVPTYEIEFANTGPISVAPSSSAVRSLLRPARTASRRATSAEYRVQCPHCGKQFRRTRSSDTLLNEHKNDYGTRCPGSGHRGFLA
jgi:predicted nucleotidyltransferase component of viral defense system